MQSIHYVSGAASCSLIENVFELSCLLWKFTVRNEWTGKSDFKSLGAGDMNKSLFLHHSQTLCQVVNLTNFVCDLMYSVSVQNLSTDFFFLFSRQIFSTDVMCSGFSLTGEPLTKCYSQSYSCIAHQLHGGVKSKPSFLIACRFLLVNRRESTNSWHNSNYCQGAWMRRSKVKRSSNICRWLNNFIVRPPCFRSRSDEPSLQHHHV